MYQGIKGIDGHLGFRISTKKKNTIEDIKLLLSIKLCRIRYF